MKLPARKLNSIYLIILMLSPVIYANAQYSTAPNDLRVDLMRHTDKVWRNGMETPESLEQAAKNRQDYQTIRIGNSTPWLSWVIKNSKSGYKQGAYQIIVSSSMRNLSANIGDLWNSKKIYSSTQLGVEYNGRSLKPSTVYYWKVRVWDDKGDLSDYSTPSAFLTDTILGAYRPPEGPLVKTMQRPQSSKKLNNSHQFYDFGKDAFGQLVLEIETSEIQDTMRIHVGEAVNRDGGVERKPKGTVRYQLLEIPLTQGRHMYYPTFKAGPQNTGPKSIPMPAYIGEVLPFRYVEVEKKDKSSEVLSMERAAVNAVFDDDASKFHCSDTVLNQVWELCKYSMKATSFAGIYVDGDRERIPYEADALINQLSHYSTDAEYNMAKRSLEYLIYNATWPTEWSLQNLQIAWYDYLYSGDIRAVKRVYKELKPKLLQALAREDGLISTRTGKQDSSFAKSIHLTFNGDIKLRDIVDWPQKGGFGLPPDSVGETDNFEFTDYNAVVNAFYYQALVCMKDLAAALDEKEDADYYGCVADTVKNSFQRSFIDPISGLVKDGETATHSSLHANMMALAFDLIPEKNVPKTLSFIRSRGMACSVYGAQFLMDALYNANDAEYGLELLTSTTKRSWYNMILTGSTMTTEAWDMEYKGNQDINHAWGAVPANTIVRRLMGIEPLSPAFGKISIKPRPGKLKYAELKLPTLRGEVGVDFYNEERSFVLNTHLPSNTSGIVYLPRKQKTDKILRNGKPVNAAAIGDFWVIDNVDSGMDRWKVEYSYPLDRSNNTIIR